MKKKTSALLICLFAYSLSFAQNRNADVENAKVRISRNLLEGDYDRAIASYDVLIAKDSVNESKYWYEKGLCYYRKHEDSASLQAFRKGISKPNAYAGNHLGVGLHLAYSNPDSALICFKKVIRLLEDSLNYLQSKPGHNYFTGTQLLSDAYHNNGLVSLHKGLLDSAQYNIFKSLDSKIGVTDEHFHAASYFFYKTNNFEKAYSYAKLATAANRYESRTALLQALSLEKLGKLTKAISSIKELIMVHEVGLTQWKRGDGSLKKDLMDSYRLNGYKHLQEINAEFYVILAYLHYRKSEKDFAAEAYKKAVLLNPDVFYTISNESSFTAFMEEFVKSKLKLPLVPKDYLPVYRNLFFTVANPGGNSSINGAPGKP